MLKWDQKCKNFRKFPCKIKQGESQIKLSETSDYDTSLTLSKEREFEWKHSRLGQVKPYGSPQAKISHQRSPVFPGNGFASISSFLPWRRSQEVWPTQMLRIQRGPLQIMFPVVRSLQPILMSTTLTLLGLGSFFLYYNPSTSVIFDLHCPDSS